MSKPFKQFWKNFTKSFNVHEYMRLKQELQQTSDLIGGQKNYMRRHNDSFQVDKLQDLLKEKEELVRQIKAMESDRERGSKDFSLESDSHTFSNHHYTFKDSNGDTVRVFLDEELSMQNIPRIATVSFKPAEGKDQYMQWRGDNSWTTAANFARKNFGITIDDD